MAVPDTMIIEFNKDYSLKQIEELLLGNCGICQSQLTINRYMKDQFWNIKCSTCDLTIMLTSDDHFVFEIYWTSWNGYMVRPCWRTEGTEKQLQVLQDQRRIFVIDSTQFDFCHWAPKLDKLLLLS